MVEIPVRLRPGAVCLISLLLLSQKQAESVFKILETRMLRFTVLRFVCCNMFLFFF